MTTTRRTPEPGSWLGIPPFPKAAKAALAQAEQRKNLRHATGTIREKRAVRAAEVDNWEELRTAAAQIKDRVGRHLADYLEQAEKAMTAAGITVHWARDAADANRIVADLAKARGVDEVVKIKSMVTQEIDLNEALEAEGILRVDGNKKGIFTRQRQPKDAAYLFRKRWTTLPVDFKKRKK